MLGMIFDMMTEKEFWDIFHKKHNPKYHYEKKKTKRRVKNKKIIPLNLKSLGNQIDAYPFVVIEWADIEGDAGWSDTKSLNKEQLPTCVSRGYLLSQAKGVTRIFTDYIKTKDKPTFDNIGNTTIIPTSVIISIKKLN